MELDLKKPLIFLAILFAIGYYVRTHYTAQDALNYSHSHQWNKWSPTINYYVAMGYYARSEYAPAVGAFNQMLTDFPTGQYTEDGLFRMGTAYEELMQWDGAKAAYQQYLDQFPDGKYKSLVQGKADVLRSR